MTDPNDDEKPAPEDDFATLFAASEAKTSTESRVRAGDAVRGRVIAIGAETAFVMPVLPLSSGASAFWP